MSAESLSISSLRREVRARRANENIANMFKLVGILALAVGVAFLAMVLAAPHRAEETLGVIIPVLYLTFLGAIHVIFYWVIGFFPFLFYGWASVTAVRQWTLLSLFQTAVETGKPLQDIVRAYATGCSRGYAAQLERFALALDSGYAPDAAIRENKGLFRYDIAGMIRLGDSPETFHSLEAAAQDEHNFAAIRTNTIVRIVYLCTVVTWMIAVMAFIFIKIIPEFEMIFRDFTVDLPPLTNVFIVASNWFMYYWYLVVPFFPLLTVIALIYLILQTNVVVLRPIGFRRVFHSTDAAKFLMVFAVGIRHRFPIPTILERYRWSVPSDYLRRKGTAIQKAVEQGGDWVDAVHRVGFVNGAEASLLKSAERTGYTATVLDQLARSKERSQIRKDDLFSKMVFIPLVLLLGAFIGTFVIAMFLPMLTLITALSA